MLPLQGVRFDPWELRSDMLHGGPKIKTGGVMYTMINIMNTALCYERKLLREEILRAVITGEQYFSGSLVLYLYEMMDIH